MIFILCVMHQVQGSSQWKHEIAKYLSEMLRYKLKENADIIFEFTWLQNIARL